MDVISLSDYQVGSNVGESNAAELAELQKALTAGSITGRETTDLTNASGAGLKVESLENTLKVITYKESDIQLWKQIPKTPAYNTVEEYNQLVDYGGTGSGFTNEGELPEEADSIYTRRAQLVKFMGTTRSVSHPMQLVNTMIGNTIQQEVKNGTLEILRKVDRAIAYGNSSNIGQEFNGLYKQHLDGFNSLDQWYDSDVVVDLKGKNLREANIEDAALAIIENFGEPSKLMGPPKVLSNFVKNFHDQKLIQPSTVQVTDGVMGQQVNQVMTQYGKMDLGYDKFLKDAPQGYKTLASAATNQKAPAVPVADAVAAKASPADANAKFAGFEGDYRYAVTASNRYGESALTNLSLVAAPDAKLTVSVGDAVDLKYAAGAGAFTASSFTIYRSVKDTTAATAAADKFYPIYTISAAELAAGYDGAAAGLVRDRNRSIENTDSAFMIEPTSDVWSFKQLAPLMKMDLAQLGPATRFAVLLYGTPILYAPKKMVKFVNIGSDLT